MLPNPSDRPKSDVVVYDGDCQFCRRQVERLNWLDRGKRLSFLTLQDPAIALLLPDLTHEQLMQEMVVVTPDGNLAEHSLVGISRGGYPRSGGSLRCSTFPVRCSSGVGPIEPSPAIGIAGTKPEAKTNAPLATATCTSNLKNGNQSEKR
jgi:hypothetical protein